MNISNFDDLLQAARQQLDPQRLLFVFTNADLPSDSTEAQRADFDAGKGGALEPMMFVDKGTDELNTFADLVQEASQFEKEWVIVFAAALSGIAGDPPTVANTEKVMEQMVESIKAGALGTFIPFDRDGQAVMLG